MRRGFSQIEVLAAVGVLAVGILSVVASFLYHLRATESSARHMQAAALANRLITTVRTSTDWGQPLPASLHDLPTDQRALNAPPLQKALFTPEELRDYQRNLLVERVSNQSDDYRHRLFLVRVQLSWAEHGSPRQLVYQAYQRQP